MEDSRSTKIRIDAPAPIVRPSFRRESEAYQALRLLASAPSFNRDSIVDFVQQHPAIAGRLLRVVNSPQFGLRVPVADLRHAIGLLGANGLQKFTEPFVATHAPIEQGRSSLVR